MGIVARQSIYNTIITYGGAVMGYGISLWLFPQFLSLEEIGLWRIIIDIALMLSALIGIGIPRAMVRFFNAAKDHDEGEKKFFIILFKILIPTATLGALICYLLRDWIFEPFLDNSPLLPSYAWLAIVTAVLFSIRNLMDEYCRANLLSIPPLLGTEILTRVGVVIFILLYAFDLIETVQLMSGIALTQCIVILFLLIFLIRKKLILIQAPISTFSKPFYKSVVHYAFFMLLSILGASFVFKIDAIMIAYYLGLEENAIYTTVFMIAIVIEMPRRAMSGIIAPSIARLFKEENYSELDVIYKKSSNVLFIISLLIYLGLVCNTDYFHVFIPKWDLFKPGIWVLILVGGAKVVDFAFGINSEIIDQSKLYSFAFVALALLGVITVISNIVFIPSFGISGAALATLISFSIFNLIKYIFVYKKLGLSPFSMSTLKILIAGLITYLSTYAIPVFENDYLNLFITSVVITTIFGLIIYFSKASTDLNERVNTIIKRIT